MVGAALGSTFLIKNVLGNRIDFEMTGIQNGGLNDQLQGFANKSSEFNDEEIKKPENWMQAFFTEKVFDKTQHRIKEGYLAIATIHLEGNGTILKGKKYSGKSTYRCYSEYPKL